MLWANWFLSAEQNLTTSGAYSASIVCKLFVCQPRILTWWSNFSSEGKPCNKPFVFTFAQEIDTLDWFQCHKEFAHALPSYFLIRNQYPYVEQMRTYKDRDGVVCQGVQLQNFIKCEWLSRYRRQWTRTGDAASV